jgi:hypothetical protein
MTSFAMAAWRRRRQHKKENERPPMNRTKILTKEMLLHGVFLEEPCVALRCADG